MINGEKVFFVLLTLGCPIGISSRSLGERCFALSRCDTSQFRYLRQICELDDTEIAH